MFLGIDHNWGDGPPLVYESMVFGLGPGGRPDFGADMAQERYSTREEAFAGHGELVAEWLRKPPYVAGEAAKEEP